MAKTQKSQVFPKRLSTLKISLTSSQRDLPLHLPRIRKVISFLVQLLKIKTSHIIFHFVTDAKMRTLHKKFFNDPSSTDCITFPIDALEDVGRDHILGEAFICPKIALVNALKYNVPPQKELYRYITHCLLHMIGYDDQNPKDRARMRRKEGFCLKKLGNAEFSSDYCN